MKLALCWHTFTFSCGIWLALCLNVGIVRKYWQLCIKMSNFQLTSTSWPTYVPNKLSGWIGYSFVILGSTKPFIFEQKGITTPIQIFLIKVYLVDIVISFVTNVNSRTIWEYNSSLPLWQNFQHIVNSPGMLKNATALKEWKQKSWWRNDFPGSYW